MRDHSTTDDPKTEGHEWFLRVIFWPLSRRERVRVRAME
jgi:hypothetical protein